MSGDSAPIRVLTVDDHQLIRGGIAALLLPESDMKLVGEASNGREAIARFRECRPDVTLMDLQMPEMNGFDAIIAIRNEFPEARIIVLTTYVGDVQALRAIKAGAQGLPAEKSPAQGTSAYHPRGSRRAQGDISRCRRPTCRAHRRRRIDGQGNRCAAADRGRQCQQTDCRAALDYGRNGQEPREEHP